MFNYQTMVSLAAQLPIAATQRGAARNPSLGPAQRGHCSAGPGTPCGGLVPQTPTETLHTRLTLIANCWIFIKPLGNSNIVVIVRSSYTKDQIRRNCFLAQVPPSLSSLAAWSCRDTRSSLQLQNKSAAESWWNTGSVTLAFWYHWQLSSIIDTPAPVPACRAAARASRICHCHFASARHCSGNCMCKAKLPAPDSATAAGLGGCSTPKQRFYVSYYVPQQEP